MAEAVHRASRWLRGALRGSVRQRPARRNTLSWSLRRRTDRELGLAAYRSANAWGDRLSQAAQEAVQLPAYEVRALRGEAAPKRFRWRGRWYRVVDVGAIWKADGPPPTEEPQPRRDYYSVIASPGELYQLYFERPPGQWVLYRAVRFRTSGRR